MEVTLELAVDHLSEGEWDGVSAVEGCGGGCGKDSRTWSCTIVIGTAISDGQGYGIGRVLVAIISIIDTNGHTTTTLSACFKHSGASRTGDTPNADAGEHIEAEGTIEQ